MYNITKLLSCSFPTENFVTFPSGPLGSSAQLLAQSHIYTLPTHTHSLTHTAFISLSRSVSCLHTHMLALTWATFSLRGKTLPLTQNISSKGWGYFNQATEVKHWHFIMAHSVTYTRPPTHMIRGIFHPCRRFTGLQVHMFEHSVSTLSNYPPRSHCQPILFEFNLFCLDSIHFFGEKKEEEAHETKRRTELNQPRPLHLQFAQREKKKDLNMFLLKVRHHHTTQNLKWEIMASSDNFLQLSTFCPQTHFFPVLVLCQILLVDVLLPKPVPFPSPTCTCK